MTCGCNGASAPNLSTGVNPIMRTYSNREAISHIEALKASATQLRAGNLVRIIEVGQARHSPDSLMRLIQASQPKIPGWDGRLASLIAATPAGARPAVSDGQPTVQRNQPMGQIPYTSYDQGPQGFPQRAQCVMDGGSNICFPTALDCALVKSVWAFDSRALVDNNENIPAGYSTFLPHRNGMDFRYAADMGLWTHEVRTMRVSQQGGDFKSNPTAPTAGSVTFNLPVPSLGPFWCAGFVLSFEAEVEDTRTLPITVSTDLFININGDSIERSFSGDLVFANSCKLVVLTGWKDDGDTNPADLMLARTSVTVDGDPTPPTVTVSGLPGGSPNTQWTVELRPIINRSDALDWTNRTILTHGLAPAGQS